MLTLLTFPIWLAFASFAAVGVGHGEEWHDNRPSVQLRAHEAYRAQRPPMVFNVDPDALPDGYTLIDITAEGVLLVGIGADCGRPDPFRPDWRCSVEAWHPTHEPGTYRVGEPYSFRWTK